MSHFLPYNPNTQSLSELVSALIGASSGINVVTNSISLKYGSYTEYGSYDPTTYTYNTTEVPSISTYDGGLSGINIGSGLLLTTGSSSPPTSNTSSSYGNSLSPSETDANLSATVDAVFPSAGSVQDATVLEFQFTVADPTTQNIQFNLVFGSDEYPEYSDTSYVDIAGVYVNGVDYALFNGSDTHPLSVLSTNLSAGAFIDNQSGVLPIEYDGISNTLTIIAPVTTGTNTIKIAIGDTGDSIYDSGLFISDMHAVSYSGSGLAKQNTGTLSNDMVVGDSNNEVFSMGDGKDVMMGGGGNDVLDGGGGIDYAAFNGTLSSYQITPTASGYDITGADGSDVMHDVERIFFTGDGLYALDTSVGGNTWEVYALFQELLNAAPSTDMLSQWVAAMDASSSLSGVAQQVLDYYVPGVNTDALVGYLYQTLAGVTPTTDQISAISSLVGTGKMFSTQGELVAALATIPLNTDEMASVVGTPIALNVAYFF